MTDEQVTWNESIERLNTFLDALSSIATFRPIPPVSDLSKLSSDQLRGRVQDCARLLDRMGYDANATHPAKSTAVVLPNRFLGPLTREAFGERALELLYSLESNVTAYIAALSTGDAFQLGFIKSDDFGETLFLNLPTNQGTISIVAAKYSSIPADHPIRNSIPETETYLLQSLVAGTFPVLLLGPPDYPLVGKPTPRPAYKLSMIRSLTYRYRAEQDQKREDREARLREERREEERAFWQSELGQQAAREIAIARLAETKLPDWIVRLQARGIVPASFDLPKPAVRVGSK